MNTLKPFALAALLLTLSACATAMRDEWVQKRGYSEEEIAETLPYHEQYGWQIAAARGSYDSVAEQAAAARIRAIYCACVKRLGDKCSRKPASLKGDERTLWAKGNAAEMVLYKQSASSAVGGQAMMPDPLECN